MLEQKGARIRRELSGTKKLFFFYSQGSIFIKLWFLSVHPLIAFSFVTERALSWIILDNGFCDFFTSEEMLKCTRWGFHGIWFLNIVCVF